MESKRRDQVDLYEVEQASGSGRKRQFGAANTRSQVSWRLRLGVALLASAFCAAGLSAAWAQVGNGICPFPRKEVKHAVCEMATFTNSTVDLLHCMSGEGGMGCQPDPFTGKPCQGNWWTGAVNGSCVAQQADGSAGGPGTDCVENAMMRPISLYRYTAVCARGFWGFEFGDCTCQASYLDPPESLLVGVCDCAQSPR